MSTTRAMVAGAVVGAMLVSGCAVRDRIFRHRGELVAERSPCVATTVPVYFDEGHARLSPPARELIAETAARLGDCRIDRVRVIGLADASGGAQRNMTLSQRRAMAVAEALSEEGWPAPAFEVLAAGEAGATTHDGTDEPVRRRAELIVEAAPRP